MKTIIKNDAVVDALTREISICAAAIKRYEKILRKFEDKYGLTSRQFSNRFNSGSLGDEQDFFEWDAIFDYYNDWTNRKQTLQESLL
jgi:hypothetical protein